MSSGTTNTPRLLAAAKEFNIGKDTLVEFLIGKGFEIDGRPTTKLTEEMYHALQASFAQDKLVKKKSDEIALPKGSLLDSNIPKTELTVETEPDKAKEVATPKSTAKKPKKEEVTEVAEEAPIETKVIENDITEEKTPDTEPKIELQETTAAPEVVATETVDENIAVEEKHEVTQQTEIEETSTPETEQDKPETKNKLQGPKVLTKIDLDAINQTTRPKKSTAKEKKVQKTKPAKKETKVEQAVTAAPQENPVASTPETSVETPPPAPTSIAPVSEEAITAPNSLFSDDI